MLQKLIDVAVRNRLIVVLALLGLIVASVAMLPKLNLDAFPDVTNVQVTVNTAAEGLAAEEVEKLISYPVESAMYALPAVTEVRSLSRTGLSIVTVVFAEGTDIYFARQQVFEQLQAAREMIPDGVGVPEIGPNTSGLGQIYQYILRATPESGIDASELRSINDYMVKLLMMPVGGVTEVLSFGGEVRQYQVQVEPNKLLSYGLSMAQVTSALESNNRNAGGWFMDQGQEQLVVRGYGLLPSGDAGLKAIAQIPLTEVAGTPVRIGDIAKVDYGSEIRVGAVTMTRRDEAGSAQDLGEVVAGVVLKRMGANTKETIDDISARTAMIEQALPDGVSFEVFYDQSDLVNQAVSTVRDALLMAFMFIVVILALFLVNIRATLLVLLSIPVSIGLALLVMSYFGMSANLMSLGGLAVAIGMLVDGSVVMVENIFKHLTQSRKREERGSASVIVGQVMQAAKEVCSPIFFATAIIIVVFAPLFALEGVEGKLFQPMAVSIILAMISALLVALIAVPALAVYLFNRGVVLRESAVLKPIETLYRKLLSVTMAHPKTLLIASVIMFAMSMMLLPRLGTEFVPELEEGTINLRVTLAPTASLGTSLDVAPKLEALLLEFPEVNYALSRIGAAELGGDPEPVNNIEIYIGLKPVNEWQSASNRFELQRKMEQKLNVYPGLLFTFSQPIATRVDELLSGVKAQLAIKIFGPDLDVLSERGQVLTDLVAQIPGAVDVSLEQVSGEAQLVVRPKRDQLARYGISVDEVMALVSQGIGGGSAGQVIDGNARYDIYVRLAEKYRNSPDAIENLLLTGLSGANVRLGEVADVAIEMAPPNIRRDDVQRRVVVQANVADRDMGSVVDDIYAIVPKAELPPGYTVVVGGQYENQQRAQQKLMLVVPISIALIALLLYFSFGSIKQVGLIMANVPLALIGGVVALFVSGTYLSVPSSIGFITLFGVAVLNGVVLVDSINQRRKLAANETDASLYEAVYEGTVGRLRPVLMTALTSALGLIPILLSSGVGSEIQQPLAVVVIGGLFSSTALTLLVLPTIYRWIYQGRS
ncbi:efflux RND transporter permease subunit [Shewanella fidelis]|uniref:CusA/CzcA family heavy metal efflux RND transporter n=1 Tax=Shewanella fidelis TaxID=173509 RepID=A0AAW8NS78_9GAMM|nr:CusA/CzcA family heavy metal efflux RND transporter [Shewanella fidelis]MDR8525270.1 CusA/CzcA family heavy metal efflux RND transporter [Shewanella fidelis]MDW4814081.1 CusA/CzcA family heavy metal efflux RND transporter [Shewanella fidelis]MDW4818259.1 CusA/CzcA family heavy metal efflux RND transporter [Shewanella fidelis]MDW4822370.1 CusA/CzcA family heavy metal efflux RND transporter [Shewanella fidelis]MDW4826508.1 CusA/CzcA family heavy metal efflux RND transporter [Shewanella fideli